MIHLVIFPVGKWAAGHLIGAVGTAIEAHAATAAGSAAAGLHTGSMAAGLHAGSMASALHSGASTALPGAISSHGSAAAAGFATHAGTTHASVETAALRARCRRPRHGSRGRTARHRLGSNPRPRHWSPRRGRSPPHPRRPRQRIAHGQARRPGYRSQGDNFGAESQQHPPAELWSHPDLGRCHGSTVAGLRRSAPLHTATLGTVSASTTPANSVPGPGPSGGTTASSR